VSPCLDSESYTYSTFLHIPSQSLQSSKTTPTLNPHYSEISLHSSTLSLISSSKLKGILEVPRCSVRLQSVIMEGSFAKIYRGSVSSINGGETQVIIKTVSGANWSRLKITIAYAEAEINGSTSCLINLHMTERSSPVQMAILLHEGLSLVGLFHENIKSVVGVAAEERVPPFLIYLMTRPIILRGLYFSLQENFHCCLA